MQWVLSNKLLRCLLPAIMLAVLAGCVATVSRTSQLRPGMPRAEVIRILGKPVSSSTSQDVEVLNYKLYESINDWFPLPYYVQLMNGRVVAFGRVGDYGVPLQTPSPK